VDDELCPDGVISRTVNDEGGEHVVCAGVGDGMTGGLPVPVEVLVAGLFVLFFLAVVVAVVRTSGKRKQALLEAGLNPHLTGEEQIAAAHRARSASAPVPAVPPARGVEERLAELDDLLRREKITSDEHARARLHILTDD